MLNNLKIKPRFTIVTLFVLVISLPIITGISYYLLRNNAIREIYKQADLLVSMMEASRHYVVKFTTPIFEREVPGKFIVQGMADSFMNHEIQKQIAKQHEDFSYKEAAINPLNLRNKADEFEQQKILEFRNGVIEGGEWRGFINKSSGDYYAVIKPIVVADMGCLSCHGDPDLAPEEITGQYGMTHGYNWKVGDTIAIDAVYVPAKVPIQQANKTIIIFAIVYVFFYLLLCGVMDFLITKSILGPAKKFVDVAEQISNGNLQSEFHIDSNDEMKQLADAFNRMKQSIVILLGKLKAKGK